MEVNLEDYEYEHQDFLQGLMDVALGYDIERLHQRIENAVSQDSPPAGNPPANNNDDEET